MKKKPSKKPSKPTTTRRRATAPAAKVVAKRTRTVAKAPVAKPAAKAAAKRPSKAVVAAAVPAVRHRHAVFIDVENTSSEEQLFEVLDQVHLDRVHEVVQVAAVGNWRVASQRLGRRLAGLGAELRHSAPATGVRDWSDLWIAVAAGYWLGRAEPGDVLEIVSNDRAFDAVGDTAAHLGVTYRRLQLKRGGTAAHAATHDEDAEAPAAPKRRRSRGGRRRRGRGTGEPRPPLAAVEHVETPAARHPVRHAAAPPPAAPPRSHFDETEPHGASRDQMIGLIGRLSNNDPARWVNLDILEKQLKAEGFARPPGSPRLVTRLRTLKEVEVDSHGRVHLRHAPPPPEPVVEAAPEPAAAEAEPKPRAARKRAPARRRKPKSATSAAEGTVEAAGSLDAPLAYGDPPLE